MKFFNPLLLLALVAVLFSNGFVRAEEAAAAATTEEVKAPSEFDIQEEKLAAAPKESFEFQAEVNRLMDIIINSLCKFSSIPFFSFIW